MGVKNKGSRGRPGEPSLPRTVVHPPVPCRRVYLKGGSLLFTQGLKSLFFKNICPKAMDFPSRPGLLCAKFFFPKKFHPKPMNLHLNMFFLKDNPSGRSSGRPPNWLEANFFGLKGAFPDSKETRPNQGFPNHFHCPTPSTPAFHPNPTSWVYHMGLAQLCRFKPFKRWGYY